MKIDVCPCTDEVSCPDQNYHDGAVLANRLILLKVITNIQQIIIYSQLGHVISNQIMIQIITLHSTEKMGLGLSPVFFFRIDKHNLEIEKFCSFYPPF